MSYFTQTEPVQLRVGDVLRLSFSGGKRRQSFDAQVTVLSVEDGESNDSQRAIASGRGVGSMRLHWNVSMAMGTGNGLAFSFVRRGTPAGFEPIETAPKNATWVKVFVEDGQEHVAHYASDLSGSEQPPYRGWFVRARFGNGYRQIPEPVGWRPLTADEVAAL